MTDAQERDLRRQLNERLRRLLAVYQDRSGRLWAVSRPVRLRNAKYDQRHRIRVSGSEAVWIESTDGAPDY